MGLFHSTYRGYNCIYNFLGPYNLEIGVISAYLLGLYMTPFMTAWGHLVGVEKDQTLKGYGISIPTFTIEINQMQVTKQPYIGCLGVTESPHLHQVYSSIWS